MTENTHRRRIWPQVVALLLLLAAAGAAAWRWRELIWILLNDQQQVQEWVARFGPWGPLVSTGLNVAQVLLAPIPGQFVGLVNGYLYGIWLGTLYSIVGLTLGRALAMALARWFGRRLVERMVDPDQLARWDRLAKRRGPAFFFLVFLIPSLPDDLVCFVIGLSPLSIPYMTLLAALGGLPGVFVSCWLGARATDLPVWAWLPLAGGTAALGWLFLRHRSSLETALTSLIDRVTGGDER